MRRWTAKAAWRLAQGFFTTIAIPKKRSVTTYAGFDVKPPSYTGWLGEQGMLDKDIDLPAGPGGVMVSAGRMMIDAAGNGLSGMTAQGDAVSALEATIGSGLLLVNTRPIRIYTLAATSGAGSSVQPRSGTRRQWSLFTLHTGIGVDITLKLWRIRLVVGAVGGYSYPLLSAQTGGGPDSLPAAGPFLRVRTGIRFEG